MAGVEQSDAVLFRCTRGELSLLAKSYDDFIASGRKSAEAGSVRWQVMLHRFFYAREKDIF
jgi:hypothetical protein